MMIGFATPIYAADEAVVAETPAVVADTTPALNIEAKNVAFQDSVYMLFLVSHPNVATSSIKLLVWTDAPANAVYEKGTQNYTLSYSSTQSYQGKDCAMFIYNKLKAKEFANNLYFRAYAVVDGVTYYSDVLKYSVLQYSRDITNSALKTVMTEMLEYGASVQSYKEYNVNRLASATFYQVNTVSGTLADGMTAGLYVAGETVSLTAPAMNEAGVPFSCWKNSKGVIEGITPTLTTVAPAADEVYTACYSAEPVQYTALADQVTLSEQSPVVLLSSGSTGVAPVSAGNGTLNIVAKNVAFQDSVYMLFLVSHGELAASDVKLLVWTEETADAVYANGTQSYTLSYSDTQNYQGTECAMYIYNKLKAKEFADNLYFRAYAEVDGVTYYSDVLKYSILQYSRDITNAALKTVMTEMLEYGAAVQSYKEYETNRLANDTFYQVTVENGTLTDGMTTGLYVNNESVTMTAPAIDANAMPFEGWKNGAGVTVSTDLTYIATVNGANETYTAFYNYDFIYTLIGEGQYSIKAADPSKLPSTVVIPTTYNGGKVVKIEANGFANCTGLTTLVISDSITTIGANAFAGCTGLTSVTFVNETGWFAGNVQLPTNHIANGIKNIRYLTETYVTSTWTYDPDNFSGDYTQPY